ncbi:MULTISPECIES: CbrC family protein [Corynebacterium]|uniref:CbrC family protein n=1 Tax=Corynebacterium TaxID=1716 RepID=UPI00124BE892|nr:MULTISPECIES: CbrC family protein [Corynebacterium]
MFDSSVTLEGSVITLTPLSTDHAEILASAAVDLHKQYWSGVPEQDGIPAYLERLCATADTGRSLPLLVRLNSDNRAVGVTGLTIDNPDVPTVTLSHTWVTRGAQSTRVFPEILALLIAYSFDTLGAQRFSMVVPRTNIQARRAAEKADLRYEGTLRSASRLGDGNVDDALVYSVLPHEFPSLMAGLQYRIDRPILPDIATVSTPITESAAKSQATVEPAHEELPVFRYHPDPVITGAIVRNEEAECPCCERTTGWAYVYRPYALERVENLCPWCIASGAAAEKYDARFVPTAPDGMPPERAEELIKRTPSFASFQEEQWQSADGDACQFLGVATAAQLESLSPEEREESGLDESFFKEEYLTWLRAQPREELRAHADPCVFAFASLNSDTLKFWMDHS